jgi:DNA-binding NarL/FixJ family response regulator
MELTPREKEVLARIAQGELNKEIAYFLGVSIKTVEKHRQSIRDKAKITDTFGYLKLAIKYGLAECPCKGLL